MGAFVDKPIVAKNPRVIDYATRHRDDFLDIYILSKCRFFLGNTSGLLGVPLTFNRPLAVANYCPFALVGLGRTTLYIPKLLRHVSNGRVLTFHEIRSLGLMGEDIRWQLNLLHSSFYQDNGLEWLENDAEDIGDLCKDMLDQLEGRSPPAEARQLQDCYRGLYTGPHSSEHAGRIGPRFILKHRHLLSPLHADRA
jgi:putative glycosyltransferase (TIGR04372 family)